MTTFPRTLLIIAIIAALATTINLLTDTPTATAADTPAAYGIDVSHYQTITSAAAVRAAGVAFAYHKVTEGRTFVDPTATAHLSELRAAGILVGGYAYAVGPDCSADAHAFRTAATARGLLTPGGLVPALDIETPGLAPVADQCVEDFYDALGGPLLVYSDSTWWARYLHPATWGARRILGWVASYTGDPGHPGFPAAGVAFYVVHQHTDHGVVPGISGLVDRDALTPGHTLADLTLGHPTVVIPPGLPLPPACPGHIVQRGDTLSGIARSWGLPWPAVASYNGLSTPDRIRPGQCILRPAHTPLPAPAVYVVQRGDTLSEIATRFRYPGGWPALARRNSLTRPDHIRPGQRLSV